MVLSEKVEVKGMTAVASGLRHPLAHDKALAWRRCGAPQVPGVYVVLVSTELEAAKMSGTYAGLDDLGSLIDEAGSRIEDRWED